MLLRYKLNKSRINFKKINHIPSQPQINITRLNIHTPHSPFCPAPITTKYIYILHKSVAVADHFMATAGKFITHLSPHILTSRSRRPPFLINISGRINSFLARAERGSLSDAPSCLFVGPVETASKETLEALYRQVFFNNHFVYVVVILTRILNIFCVIDLKMLIFNICATIQLNKRLYWIGVFVL